METIITYNVQQTQQIATKFAQQLECHDKHATVACLLGDLGSGKTTFAQGILRTLHATGPYTSPTFIVIKMYMIVDMSVCFDTIYHIDPYRVTSDDLRDLGWEEMLASPRTLIIVEWPQIVQDIIPDFAQNIVLYSDGETKRHIDIK